MNHDTDMNLATKNIWTFDCYDSDGNIKWSETNKNLVTNEGLSHIMSTVFESGTQIPTWYTGLKGSGSASQSDTMASHPNWSEDDIYNQTSRQELILGEAVDGVISNEDSHAIFSINTSATLYGAFVTSSNVKLGTSGLLYGVVNFPTARDAEAGDTLEVTVFLSAVSA